MKKRLISVDALEKEVKNGAKILFCKKSSKIKRKKRTVNAMSLLKRCNPKQKKQLLNSIGDTC